MLNQAKTFLHSQFNMKDLGELHYFLGIEVSRNDEGIFISQRKYTMDLLSEHKMEKVKPLRLPLDSHCKLTHETGSPLANPTDYQHLVGKLNYLTITRPDIMFAVHTLSQFMQKPTSAHMQAAKRVLRYLAGVPSQGILFASKHSAQLTAYSDSDWASCPISRTSTTGFCIILLGDSLISWKTKKTRRDPLRRLSIEPWHWLHVKYHGSHNC